MNVVELPETPQLTICVSTYNRSQFITETLDTIVPQLTSEVELLVLDGASSDATDLIMTDYVARHPCVRYIREKENSGLDRDYDKAVEASRGSYVWLMTDDDLLKAHAIKRVLVELRQNPDLVIVNAETWDADFSRILAPSFLKFSEDRHYRSYDQEQFFSDVGACTSFIGSVVIRRALWLARARAPYYGSLFVHVGVLFQSPRLKTTRVIAAPLVRIRYGNATWTSRGFEIWLFLWPQLVWSFDFSDQAKSKIYPREPWRMIKKLILYRALGGYSSIEYEKFLKQRLELPKRVVASAIALAPAPLVNFVAALLCLVAHRNRMVMYDLSRSPHAGYLTRIAARTLGL